MENPFFDRPIINSPYEYPSQHWELDEEGQPTQRIIESRRGAEFITPIPKPRQRGRARGRQEQFLIDEGLGLSTQDQQYEVTAAVNEIRRHVDQWRSIPSPNLGPPEQLGRYNRIFLPTARAAFTIWRQGTTSASFLSQSSRVHFPARRKTAFRQCQVEAVEPPSTSTFCTIWLVTSRLPPRGPLRVSTAVALDRHLLPRALLLVLDRLAALTSTNFF